MLGAFVHLSSSSSPAHSRAPWSSSFHCASPSFRVDGFPLDAYVDLPFLFFSRLKDTFSLSFGPLVFVHADSGESLFSLVKMR